MQELDKILKQIDQYVRLYQTPSFGREIEGTVELLEVCGNIIRKHMNDGWIPVEKRLPEDAESDFYNAVNVTMKNGRVTHGCYRNEDEEWLVALDDGEFRYTRSSDVIAWRPLPEPYIPERNKKE